MATIPAATECHFSKPNTKSTTAPIEKKATAVGRLISTALCSTLRNLCDSNRKWLGENRNLDITPINATQSDVRAIARSACDAAHPFSQDTTRMQEK